MNFVTFLNLIKNLPPNLRLLLAIGAGWIVALLMPIQVDWELRVVSGWDVGILIFLLLIGYTMIDSSPEQTIAYARLRRINSGSFFALVVLTACISIFVVGVILIDTKDTPQPFRTIQIWFSLIAILCSWALTHIMFALHYAHIYYKAHDPQEPLKFMGGLQITNEVYPDYLDFIYFSFTIGMTSQTSDVVVTTRPLRRLVLLHAFVSFFFYTVILGTTVNTIASLV
jgi:uncharacterized membrane protein